VDLLKLRAGVVTSAAGLTSAEGPVAGTSKSPLAATKIPASPTNYIGRKVAFIPVVWAPLEALLFWLKKRKKYENATFLPEESLENGKLVGIIKRRVQCQHFNLYSINFQFKTFKSIMLSVD
jgi:hypothetical protein